MSAEILPFESFCVRLPEEWRTEKALAALRDDFCLSFVILKHAIQKDLAAFTFAGLRHPAALHNRAVGTVASYGEPLAIEMSIFQDHMHDRIALLAQNTRMLREIWGVNKRTRVFRQLEMKAAETACITIDHVSELVAALEERNEARIVVALLQCRDRRIALIDRLRTPGPALSHDNS